MPEAERIVGSIGIQVIPVFSGFEEKLRSGLGQFGGIGAGMAGAEVRMSASQSAFGGNGAGVGKSVLSPISPVVATSGSSGTNMDRIADAMNKAAASGDWAGHAALGDQMLGSMMGAEATALSLRPMMSYGGAMSGSTGINATMGAAVSAGASEAEIQKVVQREVQAHEKYLAAIEKAAVGMERIANDQSRNESVVRSGMSRAFHQGIQTSIGATGGLTPDDVFGPVMKRIANDQSRNESVVRSGMSRAFHQGIQTSIGATGGLTPDDVFGPGMARGRGATRSRNINRAVSNSGDMEEWGPGIDLEELAMSEQRAAATRDGSVAATRAGPKGKSFWNTPLIPRAAGMQIMFGGWELGAAINAQAAFNNPILNRSYEQTMSTQSAAIQRMGGGIYSGMVMGSLNIVDSVRLAAESDKGGTVDTIISTAMDFRDFGRPALIKAAMRKKAAEQGLSPEKTEAFIAQWDSQDRRSSMFGRASNKVQATPLDVSRAQEAAEMGIASTNSIAATNISTRQSQRNREQIGNQAALLSLGGSATTQQRASSEMTFKTGVSALDDELYALDEQIAAAKTNADSKSVLTLTAQRKLAQKQYAANVASLQSLKDQQFAAADRSDMINIASAKEANSATGLQMSGYTMAAEISAGSARLGVNQRNGKIYFGDVGPGMPGYSESIQALTQVYRGASINEERTNISFSGTTNVLNALLANRPLDAEKARINAEYDSMKEGITNPDRLRQIESERTKKLQLADQETKQRQSLINMAQSTRAEQIRDMMNYNPIGAEAAGISGAALIQSKGYQYNGDNLQAAQELRNGEASLQLLRQQYLDAFRGHALDLRMMDVSNRRDQDDPASVLKTISEKISELDTTLKNMTAN